MPFHFGFLFARPEASGNFPPLFFFFQKFPLRTEVDPFLPAESRAERMRKKKKMSALSGRAAVVAAQVSLQSRRAANLFLFLFLSRNFLCFVKTVCLPRCASLLGSTACSSGRSRRAGCDCWCPCVCSGGGELRAGSKVCKCTV